MSTSVVVLAGGTGGAKLARGMLDVAGAGLTVIANTGDDVDVHRAHVSPDPDLVAFWLADRIDERGWGLHEDTFHAMDELERLGAPQTWFRLGDRDLAIGLWRAARLAEGARLTEVLGELTAALGIPARVVPMSDDPVRTRVRAQGRWWDFQEFMIVGRARGPVEDMQLAGIEDAAPPPEALEAIANAEAIVVGPSNPVISIGPILAVPGMREALRAASAPVVAVSPLVGGQVVKGPTDAFMAWAGHELSATGVAAMYEGVIDGMIADEPCAAVPTRVADVAMPDAAGRRRVAEVALEHARALRDAS
jgi:LPPG:FO 2-phospho-L-lactate transferase